MKHFKILCETGTTKYEMCWWTVRNKSDHICQNYEKDSVDDKLEEGV